MKKQDICTGKWQIVVISPEMMLSKRFIANVLRNPEMRERILSVVVDEAHVVSHWGSGFRKKYGTLGILRALLPKDTPMVAMSATLPSRVRHDVINKLQFDESNYTYSTSVMTGPMSLLLCGPSRTPLTPFATLIS
jgi:superfamily II DNA helicase RecQ